MKPEGPLKSPKIQHTSFKISEFLVKTVHGVNGSTSPAPLKTESLNKENSYLTFLGNDDSKLKLYNMAEKTVTPIGRPHSMSMTRRNEVEN